MVIKSAYGNIYLCQIQLLTAMSPIPRKRDEAVGRRTLLTKVWQSPPSGLKLNVQKQLMTFEEPVVHRLLEVQSDQMWPSFPGH